MTADVHPLDTHRDPTTERLLDSHHAHHQLGWLPLDGIDWAATAAAQIRTEQLNEETVERYTATLTDGGILPAVVARPHPDGGRWTILAGVHRATAHQRAGLDRIPAYHLHAGITDRTAYLIAVEDNTTHGLPLTNSERAAAAITMIDDHGIPRIEAAKRAGITVAILDRHLAVQAGHVRANRLGIVAYRKLSSSVQSRIQQATTRHGDHVFAEAVLAVHACKATTTQAFELAAVLSTAADPEDALIAVEDWEADNHPASRSSSSRGGSRATVHQWRGHARALLDMDPNDVAASVLPSDRALTLDQIARLALRCQDVAKAIQAGAR